jgi:peptidoglycan/LPS O-acetylase OafA/YrhL
MQMAWAKAHASAPLAQHIAVSVSVFILAFVIAWAAYKLYDIPVREWLSRKSKPAVGRQ